MRNSVIIPALNESELIAAAIRRPGHIHGRGDLPAVLLMKDYIDIAL